MITTLLILSIIKGKKKEKEINHKKTSVYSVAFLAYVEASSNCLEFKWYRAKNKHACAIFSLTCCVRPIVKIIVKI